MHTLSAQPFVGVTGTGVFGPTETLHFSLIHQAPAATSSVTCIILYNTLTNKDIKVLQEGMTLDLSLLPASLGIRLTTTGSVGSLI